MHANTSFWNFLCYMKIQYEFFLRDLAVCIKTKKNILFILLLFFLFFYENQVFNTGFVSLQYKNTNRYWSKYSKIFAENHRFFKRMFFEECFFRAGPNPAHVAGLDQATRAWSLAQASDPNKLCTRKILRVHGIALFMLVFADSKNEPLV